jgi:hypothetical protein
LTAPASLEELADFTYRELDISSFIWPAIYLGFFDRLLWVKHQHRRSSGGWRLISISGKNKHCTEFVLREAPLGPVPDGSTTAYAPITTGERFTTDQPVVLDIDLDYFCCNEYPNPPMRQLEITQAAFEGFNKDIYHFLHLAPTDKIRSVARDGSYYLVYYDYRCPLPDEVTCREQIQQRTHGLRSFLVSNAVQPRLVVLSRSVYSGYTPQEYATTIEQSVLSCLEELYNLERRSIADMLPARMIGPTQSDIRSPSELEMCI